MNMEIECPEDFQGPVVGDVIKRRGVMTSTDVIEGNCIIKAEVPLAETFGYATDLRSMTQGQGTFTMELATYNQVPAECSRRHHRSETQGRLGRGQVVDQT